MEHVVKRLIQAGMKPEKAVNLVFNTYGINPKDLIELRSRFLK